MKRIFMSLVVIGALFANTILLAGDWKVQKELYDAIKKDDTKKIESILKKHPTYVNKKIEYHNYPVFDAASGAHLKALKVLVEKGADLKKKESKTGNSIMHFAADNFRVKKEQLDELFNYLIKEKKLSINIKNKKGATPFNYAFISNVRMPSKKGAIILIDIFDKYKANFNAQDSAGTTVLNYIVGSITMDRDNPDDTKLTSYLTVAKALMEKKGVNVNLPNKKKQTPLVTFLVKTQKMDEESRVDFVTAFMENGAKNNIKSKKGEKALKLVKRKGDLYKIMKKKYKKKR